MGKEFKKLKEKVGRKMVVDVLKFNESENPNLNAIFGFFIYCEEHITKEFFLNILF